MSPVEWQVFCSFEDGSTKFTDSWLLTAENVVSTFRDGSQWCRLCGSVFTGLPAVHVAGHEPGLYAWREQQRSNVDPELEAKLAEAVALVDGGLSQRKAATMAGVGRSTLGNALRSRDRSASGVATPPDDLHPASGPRPPGSGSPVPAEDSTAEQAEAA